MRLFQQQTVYNTVDTPTPAPPPLPPFLPDQDEERRLSLLRESTSQLREGRQRLPTPDRAAIMDLSSSFKKRRLGKQQQILSEITQRCREQEVTDLSSTITAKVQLKKTGEEGEEAAAMYTAISRMPHMKPRARQLHGSLSTGDLRDLDSIERRVKSEKGYKFFPARKIMRRQPTRLQLITSTIVKTAGAGASTGGGGAGGGGGGGLLGAGGGGGGGGGGGSTHRDPPPTIGGASIDFLKGVRPTDPDTRAQILERQTINGSIQLQHYLQPKLDAMAPLLLPDLHRLDGAGVYQDRLDSYFTSSRVPLNQRSRSFLDSSSVSSRSFRSMYTAGHRPTGSRHHLRSKRSERGPHVLHETEDDDVGIRDLGMSASGEVPIDLKSSTTTALRPGSQKV